MAQVNREVTAIVLARGGSKRVPDKNLKHVGGISLLMRAIAAGNGAGLNVVVSTDSDLIAEKATKGGAQVVRRGTATASDGATSEEALLEVVTVLGLAPEGEVLLLQPTSPLRTAADTKDFLKSWSRAKSLQPELRQGLAVVQELSDFWMLSDKGIPARVREGEPRREQDRKTWFRETGALYVSEIRRLVETRSLISGTLALIKCHPRTALDVNTPWDLRIAQSVALGVGASALDLDV